MRDFILTQSIARDSAFVFPKLRRMLRSWFVKRDLARLERFDDYMLSDIGLTRGDLRHLRRLPLDVDLTHEMDRLRETRARGTRRA
ncbi:hypothetical protein DK847_19735 [Aestuariivirga litoralis]|uniref:DUF1127 domain-containing protein n=1 Tax=Aestuariivirga litoralis TaxID=2650924 RepID=A0A2W2AI72_9HYPH|nr:DUF1127 domain-containing protein [Aestuariivirga litoralis]PZF75155.1 hypothetical protein DK847_19735 [Aestuariivirga litoralis]